MGATEIKVLEMLEVLHVAMTVKLVALDDPSQICSLYIVTTHFWIF